MHDIKFFFKICSYYIIKLNSHTQVHLLRDFLKIFIQVIN